MGGCNREKHELADIHRCERASLDSSSENMDDDDKNTIKENGNMLWCSGLKHLVG